ncbi:MAG: hypothetical protein Q4G24_16245, partial [Paracoccus sp. (in: a-proteobacteria)]|uniref:hypothetical protein n=1 Tax=Paracoccus sp. TaxID=267 RepID=UPI0026E0657C
VLFRHADANVLAQVVPAMNPAQLARLIGPGRRILGAPENGWADGMLTLNRDEVWPAPYSGPMRLDHETMKRIESVRFRWLAIRTTAYLRRYANDATANVPNDKLQVWVKRWLQSAAGFGVTEEAAFRK